MSLCEQPLSITVKLQTTMLLGLDAESTSQIYCCSSSLGFYIVSKSFESTTNFFSLHYCLFETRVDYHNIIISEEHFFTSKMFP